FFNSRALAFSPDGRRLAVSVFHNAGPADQWASRVYRWELAPNGPKELGLLEGVLGMIQAVRVTGDGSGVLAVSGTKAAVAGTGVMTAGKDGTVRHWRLP